MSMGPGASSDLPVLASAPVPFEVVSPLSYISLIPENPRARHRPQGLFKKSSGLPPPRRLGCRSCFFVLLFAFSLVPLRVRECPAIGICSAPSSETVILPGKQVGPVCRSSSSSPQSVYLKGFLGLAKGSILSTGLVVVPKLFPKSWTPPSQNLLSSLSLSRVLRGSFLEFSLSWVVLSGDEVCSMTGKPGL